MRKTLLVAAVLAALAAGAKTSTPVGWTDDYDAALKKAAAEKKFVVADFSGSDWCGWCKRLDREVFDTETFRKDATNRFVLLMIDTPADQSLLSAKAKAQNPALVKKYAIRGFPTVLMLDSNGKVVHRTGYQEGGPAPYLELLNAAAEQASKAAAPRP
ncbi:MAG: thioredoxin family protein [Kiritimatiellia bacterium]